MALFSLEAKAAEEVFGVGFVQARTSDPMGGEMQYSLWYPTETADGVVKLRLFEFPGTQGAEPAAGPFGLIVLSHGHRGSDLGHRDTAIALARAGYVAAAVLHPRNNFRDNSGAGGPIVWEGRPRQISALIDRLLKHPDWSDRIDPKRVGAFGFSFGGYTMLALAGARPDPAANADHCRRHSDDDPFCTIAGLTNEDDRRAWAERFPGPAQSFHDERICAAVIADPLAAPFSDATLKAMPPRNLLFYRPESENVLKAGLHVSRVVSVLKGRDDFPDPIEIVIPKSHHYSFIAPFPEAIAKDVPRLASDQEGFDRAAAHDEMNRTIVRFFGEALSGC